MVTIIIVITSLTCCPTPGTPIRTTGMAALTSGAAVNLYWSGPWISLSGPFGTRFGHRL